MVGAASSRTLTKRSGSTLKARKPAARFSDSNKSWLKPAVEKKSSLFEEDEEDAQEEHDDDEEVNEEEEPGFAVDENGKDTHTRVMGGGDDEDEEYDEDDEDDEAAVVDGDGTAGEGDYGEEDDTDDDDDEAGEEGELAFERQARRTAAKLERTTMLNDAEIKAQATIVHRVARYDS